MSVAIIEIYDSNGILQTGGVASGGSFAPLDATYWTATANATLSNEYYVGALPSGCLLKHNMGQPAQAVAGTDYVTPDGVETLTNKTLTLPTIASFANAQHNHTGSGSGGQLTTAAIASIAEEVQDIVGAFMSAGAGINLNYNDAGNLLTIAVSLVAGDIPNLDASKITTGALPMARGGTNADLSTADGVLRANGGTVYPYKWNFAAAAPPTITDDIGQGYKPGSVWLDTTNIKAYICISNAAGAANWKEITIQPTDVAHNTTTGLQGGTIGERYHLTSNQNALLSQNQNANKFLAGPSTGAAAAPTYRSLVAADLPAMVGDSGLGGAQGAVPAPAAGDSAKYLRGDGTWQTVSASGSVPPPVKVYMANTFV